MSDLAEILMIEHAAIRHIRKSMEEKPDYQTLAVFHNYLEQCHIEIEEEILFPLVVNNVTENKPAFREEAMRIMADHKLIKALFGNLEKWFESKDTEKFNTRFPLYFRLLQEHNDKEDSVVFPHWASMGENELKDAKKEASAIIDAFGKKRYLEVTGLSEYSYTYLFR